MALVVDLPPDEPASPEGVKTGGWWRLSDDELTVICGLCPRSCKLPDGQRGFCFVRQNRGGRMTLTTYGRSTGFCIDPVEKKPLNHFYPGTAILSFGTAGCNLGCKFCQNWSISKSRQVESLSEAASPEAIAVAAEELGCRSVAFTYNDPVVWAEYAIDAAKACRERGVKTVAVTAGYIQPPARRALFQAVDAANVDLKAFSEEFYARMAAGQLAPVLDTLRWIARESDVWLEITTLLIPRENDDSDELQRMCDWIVAELGPDVPLHFSAFHPDFRLQDRESTPLATLLRAREIALRAGLHYVYTGNVSHRATESTYCPACGKMLIQRDGYALREYALDGNRCRHCQAEIAGRFDPHPGDWGSRRQAVEMAPYVQLAATRRAEAAAKAPPREVAPPRPKLTRDQEQRVFQAACKRLAAAVTNQPAEPLARLLDDLAHTPVYGAFVTVKRNARLRSCCGFLGQTVPLFEALEHAAVRTAKDDPRFPPLSPSELAHLHVDVWLLWGLQPVAAKGEDRAAAITIGKHGLQIARGNHRGLLLPGVAGEHKLDARQFLEHVCLKAGLPTDAWKADNVELQTFEGLAIEGPMLLADEFRPVEAQRPNAAELLELAGFFRGNLRALYEGATPSCYLPGGYDGDVCGLGIVVSLPGDAAPLDVGMLALREPQPLQATLFNLAESTVAALRRRRLSAEQLRRLEVQLTVLSDPALHGPAAEVDLAGFSPQRRAIVVADGQRSAWVFDPQKTAEQLLAEAQAAIGAPDRDGLATYSAAAASTALRAAAAFQPQTSAGSDVRPPAVAGTFYPGDARAMQNALDEMLPRNVRPEPWPTALVPHAGWIYSGRLAAATLARVRIPERVIVLCPRHRGSGAAWAVAPHRQWALPGATVPSDPDLARRLAAGITGLELDAAAHRQEHAIEVQLPLIARLAPGASVVGIAVGGGELASLRRFGQQLADVLATLEPRPLLVISSDMNHFANDAETRRLDRLALDALATLDPERLYRTVTDQRISMCGMFPAVIVLEALKRLGLLRRCEMVGYATSAEASGDTARCVGYAGALLG